MARVNILAILGKREGYAPDQCYKTCTTSELIECLQYCLEEYGNLPIFLNNDNSYTYGSINCEDIHVEDVDIRNIERWEEEYPNKDDWDDEEEEE